MMMKTFVVNKLEDAEEIIHKEFGPQAVILTSRQVTPKGFLGIFSPQRFEVTAAVEEQDLETFKKLRDLSDISSKLDLSEEERLAADSQAEEKDLLQDNLYKLKSLSETDDESSYDPFPVSGTYRDPRFNKRMIADEIEKNTEETITEDSLLDFQTNLELATVDKAQEEKFSLHDLLNLGNELTNIQPSTISAPHDQMDEKLRLIIRQEIERLKPDPFPLLSETVPPIGHLRFLIGKGISYSIATEIESRLNSQFGITDLNVKSAERTTRLNALKKELEGLIKTAGPLSFIGGQPTILAIVGPSGVGKTTTVAKIAYQYQQELGKQVALITLDSQKNGTDQQLDMLAEKYSFPLTHATTAFELKQAIQNLQASDLILIDTHGLSPYQGKQIEELVNILSTIDQLQIQLAVSATTKDADVYGAIQQFSRLNFESLIVTKLDETIMPGLLVNVGVKTGKPLSYWTSGPQVTEDLKIANPEEIARCILTQHNTPDCIALRNLALS